MTDSTVQVHLTPEANRVWCVYPVSGTYTTFQRGLFLLLLVFVLCGQYHEWLTAASLGFVASYSAIAALHSIILNFQSNPQYDSDIFAASQIVEMVLLASIFCFLFSPRFFDQNTSLLIYSWLILILASHIVTAVSFPSVLGKITSSLVLSLCYPDRSCNDPCSNMNIPTTLFRGYLGDSMNSVSWEPMDTANIVLPGPSDAESIIPTPISFGILEGFRLLMLVSFKRSLAFAGAIINMMVSPKSARDDIFLRCLSRRRLKCPPSSPKWKNFLNTALVWLRQIHWWILPCLPVWVLFYILISVLDGFISWYFKTHIPTIDDLTYLEPCISGTRYRAGKYAAMSWYIVATIGYFTWLTKGILDIVDAEKFLWTIPESESVRAVGQWGPWLTLVLALIAAIVGRLAEDGATRRQHWIPWLNFQRFPRFYSQVKAQAMQEWKESRAWWASPIESTKDALRLKEEKGNSGEFRSKMLSAIDLALYQHPELGGHILPPPRVKSRTSWLTVMIGSPQGDTKQD